MAAVLYSFRRCPYAMRARLALLAAGITVELREILLRDKPAAMLAASSMGTVPVLACDNGVIDQSLGIMLWALRQSDPQGLLAMPAEGHALIAQNDGPFKSALDRVKYAARYPAPEVTQARQTAVEILTGLDARITEQILDRPSLADLAILPFIRQFALVDPGSFATQPWPRLQAWLDRFLKSDDFTTAMTRYPVWQPGAEATPFPSLG